MSGVRRVGTAPPAGPAAGRSDWQGCLRETCELLWPPPAVVTLEDGSAARPDLAGGLRPAPAGAWPNSSEFALIAGIHGPPLLAPADGRVAAAALLHHSRPRSSAGRLGVKALSLGLAGGLRGPMLRGRVRVSAPPGADTIEDYLRTVLSRDVKVSMYLGPVRANRKPVLELLADTGEPAAFAKIGINDLTGSLVRAEHESLVRLGRAGLTQIMIPRVLHHDRWHGLEVLVLSPLPAWVSPRRLSAPRLAAAMAELARVDGLAREPLAGGEYLRLLRTRLAAADQGAEQNALLHALDDLTARAGGEILTLGCWHGDWSPWNMASTGRGLLVWDWERFTYGVPLGFDALHYRLQAEAAAGHRRPAAAALRCALQAPRQLAGLGIGDRQARLTAILYLADLATRYLTDRQAQAGAWLGAPGTWLIPAVTAGLEQLLPDLNRP